jgi:hypothetical protein
LIDRSLKHTHSLVHLHYTMFFSLIHKAMQELIKIMEVHHAKISMSANFVVKFEEV